MKKALLCLCCVLMVFALSPVFAEDAKIEAGDLGFSFYTGFPVAGEFMVGGYETMFRYGGVGVVYHPVSFLSIEPGIFLYKKHQDQDNQLTGTTDEDDYLYVGGSLALFYNRNIAGGLYLYVGPRYDVGRYEYDENNDDGSKGTTRETDMSLSAILGLKYLVTEHLAIFGDFGFGIYWTNREYEWKNNLGVVTTKYERKTDSFSLSRGALGVIFYL